MFKGSLKQKNEILNNQSKQGGNAMVYVLIALALFGFLTITLSSQNDQADGQDLDNEQAELYANELISYVASAQQAVDMMLATGSEISDLDFVIPSDAAFDTPPHVHKVFHPQGGGLNYQASFNNNIKAHSTSAWYITTNSTYDWTPSILDDVTINALRIKREICEIINEKITGVKTIPQINNNLTVYFQNGVDFTTTSCPDCEGYPTLCVVNNAGDYYAFYNIIAAQ